MSRNGKNMLLLCIVHFWATICKAVRPMLSDRCPVLSSLSVLSVTLVYCGQTVEWIKMKLVIQVGFSPPTLC